MDPLLLAPLGLVALGALVLPLFGTLHAWRWSRASVMPASAWRPPASVIVPCRGEHPGLAENLAAFAAQAYPQYDLLFVVDAKDDPSVRELETFAARCPRARIVFSEPARLAEGWATGKIVAQLAGMRAISPGTEVVVFADADARPPPTWLAALVAPLADASVGAVTGYRWYTAAGPATPWTALRDAWNAVGLDAMTMERFRFLWGGSMAVRRHDLERCDLPTFWKSYVSEDVGLTRAVERLGLRIAFAPGAMVASPETWSGPEVRAWMVRQTALTRVSLPALYRFAWAVYALSLVLAVAGTALLLAPDPRLRALGGALLVPLLSALPRAWLRERLVRRALPSARASPGWERALQLAMSLVVTPAMLWTLHQARRMHHIQWRGRTYALGTSDGSRGRAS